MRVGQEVEEVLRLRSAAAPALIDEASQLRILGRMAPESGWRTSHSRRERTLCQNLSFVALLHIEGPSAVGLMFCENCLTYDHAIRATCNADFGTEGNWQS